MRRYVGCILAMLCVLVLAGCDLTDGPALEWHASLAEQAPGAHRPLSAPYILGPNDRVHVDVYGETELTNDYEVDGSGSVNVPLAGRVKAAGLTTTQLAHAIAGKLSDGIIREPRVTVEMASYAPYYISGEVKQGGEFVYKNGMTLRDAVAAAGGFTYRADEDRVYLRRAGGRTERLYRTNEAIPVYPGDNIRIPERYF